MVTLDVIKEFCKKIVQEFSPKKILLFGSYAKGTQTPDSDVDLFLVMPHKGKAIMTSVQIRMKLRPAFPVDLIIRSPGSLQKRLEMGDVFLRDILKTGLILYEENHARMD